MAIIGCRHCGTTVYSDALAMANHDLTTLPDGRSQWFSRDFGIVVHECPIETEEARAERVACSGLEDDVSVRVGIFVAPTLDAGTLA
jgi:CxxC motif-containing protein (DUF1111 family)